LQDSYILYWILARLMPPNIWGKFVNTEIVLFSLPLFNAHSLSIMAYFYVKRGLYTCLNIDTLSHGRSSTGTPGSGSSLWRHRNVGRHERAEAGKRGRQTRPRPQGQSLETGTAKSRLTTWTLDWGFKWGDL